MPKPIYLLLLICFLCTSCRLISPPKRKLGDKLFVYSTVFLGSPITPYTNPGKPLFIDIQMIMDIRKLFDTTSIKGEPNLNNFKWKFCEPKTKSSSHLVIQGTILKRTNRRGKLLKKPSYYIVLAEKEPLNNGAFHQSEFQAADAGFVNIFDKPRLFQCQELYMISAAQANKAVNLEAETMSVHHVKYKLVQVGDVFDWDGSQWLVDSELILEYYGYDRFEYQYLDLKEEPDYFALPNYPMSPKLRGIFIRQILK